jgi:hypothetical protein
MFDTANNPPVGNSLGDTFLRERAILRSYAGEASSPLTSTPTSRP